MGLLTAGYFQSTYFAKDYWADDYWTNSSVTYKLTDTGNFTDSFEVESDIFGKDTCSAQDFLEIDGHVSCIDSISTLENVGDIYIEGATDSCIATDETSIQLEATVIDSGKGISTTDIITSASIEDLGQFAESVLVVYSLLAIDESEGVIITTLSVRIATLDGSVGQETTLTTTVVQDNVQSSEDSEITATLKAVDRATNIGIVNVNALLPVHDLAVGLDLPKFGYQHRVSMTAVVEFDSRSLKVSRKTRSLKVSCTARSVRKK